MVVVAARRLAGVEELRLAAIDRNRVDPSAAVEEEVLSVAGPVGRLEMHAGAVAHPALAGLYVDGLEAALHPAFGLGGWAGLHTPHDRRARERSECRAERNGRRKGLHRLDWG